MQSKDSQKTLRGHEERELIEWPFDLFLTPSLSLAVCILYESGSSNSSG